MPEAEPDKGELLNGKRLLLGGLGSAAVVVLAAASSWACVSGPVVNLSTVQAKPGDVVTITGTGFRQPDLVQVRWNALDGPVLAELAKPDNQTISVPFTVPPGTPPGNYVVIVTQSRDGNVSLSPIRAVLSVVGPTGQAPVLGAALTSDSADRAPGLVRSDDSISTGTLALVSLGVAGLGMFAAGVAALAASRRGGPGATPAVAGKR